MKTKLSSCDRTELRVKINKSSTLNSDRNVRKIATEKRDSQMLSKLAHGDIPALDA